jgi:hypothetical protein
MADEGASRTHSADAIVWPIMLGSFCTFYLRAFHGGADCLLEGVVRRKSRLNLPSLIFAPRRFRVLIVCRFNLNLEEPMRIMGPAFPAVWFHHTRPAVSTHLENRFGFHHADLGQHSA